MLCYTMIRYVTECTTCKSWIAKQKEVSGMKHRMQGESIPKEVHNISRFSMASCGIRERLYRSCQRNKNPKAVWSQRLQSNNVGHAIQMCPGGQLLSRRNAMLQKIVRRLFFLEKKKCSLFLSVSETGRCHWLLGKHRECNLCGSIGMPDHEDGSITFFRDVSNYLPLDTP